MRWQILPITAGRIGIHGYPNHQTSGTPRKSLRRRTTRTEISVILEDDMVDYFNPGDIVRITGNLKTVRDEKTKRFTNYIYGNYIEPLEQEFEELTDKSGR